MAVTGYCLILLKKAFQSLYISSRAGLSTQLPCSMAAGGTRMRKYSRCPTGYEEAGEHALLHLRGKCWTEYLRTRTDLMHDLHNCPPVNCVELNYAFSLLQQQFPLCPTLVSWHPENEEQGVHTLTTAYFAFAQVELCLRCESQLISVFSLACLCTQQQVAWRL